MFPVTPFVFPFVVGFFRLPFLSRFLTVGAPGGLANFRTNLGLPFVFPFVVASCWPLFFVSFSDCEGVGWIGEF